MVEMVEMGGRRVVKMVDVGARDRETLKSPN
jgi:hypothetical protein